MINSNPIINIEIMNWILLNSKFSLKYTKSHGNKISTTKNKVQEFFVIDITLFVE